MKKELNKREDKERTYYAGQIKNEVQNNPFRSIAKNNKHCMFLTNSGNKTTNGR